MRIHRCTALLPLCAALLLAGGCGLVQGWRENKLRSYHQSRFEAIARQRAFPAEQHTYPSDPAPKSCQDEVEPQYFIAFAAQKRANEQWEALNAACADSIEVVSSMTSALAQRDGAAVGALTPVLSKSMESTSQGLELWREANGQVEGALQSLQVAWLKVWPGNDLQWDLSIEVDQLRRQAFEQSVGEEAEALAKETEGGSGRKVLAHLQQQAENTRVAALTAYHDERYGRLAATYLERRPQIKEHDLDLSYPQTRLDPCLEQLETLLAARYELDLAIVNELDRFEYVTGLSLEEVLELPAEDLYEPPAEEARKEIAERERQRREQVNNDGSRSKGDNGLPLSRRSVWLMLKDGRVPSLDGAKMKQLKGQRRETVEVTLARLEFFRELDELLTTCINVQLRELNTQWEIAWPAPAVETDIFEYALTLPEAQDVAPDSETDP